MTTKQITTKTYVLHQRPYRNTSLILRLLVEGRGLVDGVYRGGQQKDVQLFTPYWLHYLARDGLQRVDKLESLDKAVMPTHNALLCAFYVNEILVKLLQLHEPQQDIFIRYEQVITTLCESQSLDIVLRRFELQLLKDLGFAITLDREARSDKLIDAAEYYDFFPEAGLVKVANNTKRGEYCYSGRDLLAISSDNYALKSTRLAAKKMMRQMLDSLLNGQRLHSRELFMGVVQ